MWFDRGGVREWRNILDCCWVLPVYPAVVLTEQGCEVFVFGCEGGKVGFFVVVRALGWVLGFRHFCVGVMIE